MKSKEALENLYEFALSSEPMEITIKDFKDIIEKNLEVLEIIEKTSADIKTLKQRLRFKKDDVYLHYKYDFIMTREEFDLLKEWMERNEIQKKTSSNRSNTSSI